MQELCTHIFKYAYRKELSIQPKALAKNQMFSTASSSLKQPEYPLFRAQVSAKKKGKCFSDIITCSVSVFLRETVGLPTAYICKLLK